jgi:glutamyl-tRNA reductase
MTPLSVIGVSFRTAPIAIREQVSLRPQGVTGALQRLRASFPDSEFVLLSTCNRTELYLAGLDIHTSRDRLIRLLVEDDAAHAAITTQAHFYLKTNQEAAEHLFAVAASLDAMVVGETEVLGQVKQAFALAEEARAVGRTLVPLFQQVFRTAKRVHTETDICRGRVSVSSLAVSFAEKVFDDLGSKTAMLVGAGEMAELALKSLQDLGVRDVLILNRSHERGQALAGQCSGRALPFDLLDDYLARADIVISSTSAPHIVIRAEAVRRAIAARHGRPMLLVDIAVPRDIEAEAGQIRNVYLYSIDDLQRLAAENLARRQQAVDQAWQIVRAEAAAALAQSAETGLRLLLRDLDDHGRSVCEAALQRTLAKEKLATLPEPCREEIRDMARKIVSKLLAEPREALKRAARTGDWEHYAHIVRDLHGLARESGSLPPHASPPAPPGSPTQEQP